MVRLEKGEGICKESVYIGNGFLQVDSQNKNDSSPMRRIYNTTGELVSEERIPF